jgi:hypothetical protein
VSRAVRLVIPRWVVISRSATVSTTLTRLRAKHGYRVGERGRGSRADRRDRQRRGQPCAEPFAPGPWPQSLRRMRNRNPAGAPRRDSQRPAMPGVPG